MHGQKPVPVAASNKMSTNTANMNLSVSSMLKNTVPESNSNATTIHNTKHILETNGNLVSSRHVRINSAKPTSSRHVKDSFQEAPAKRQDYLPASIKLITSDLDDDLPPSDPRTRQEDTEEEFEMDSDSEIADYNRVISLFTRD
ncbi:hypothetical protein M422DRAFT_255149 [Sphaerobolus stellatus SS14]|uniref:Uncharacterized protein n=1 Tax=Sphaerobolus stellatus (strain SS14) TaxID=990650 RepID=A0A0C9VUC4_SPHS4|nr:hypothetical protein M422DRAFT_255149 [Sphaerobolus stellatus SS14]